MAESGRVKGAHNVKQFEEFVSLHNQENDWGKYVCLGRKKLIRKLVCKECGFGRSALIQNKLLKTKFEHLEFHLRQRGILVTESLQQHDDIEFPDQEGFIKTFEDRVTQFKADAEMLKELLDQYSKELEKLN